MGTVTRRLVRTDGKSVYRLSKGECKVNVKTFAAISVGSFELTMKIYEFSGKNTIREIDCLSQRMDLGSETYATGKLSKEKIDELCRTLLDFRQVMKAYRVDAFRAYGTSALRETENTLIVLDQI
ncbi:MAG: hypothetical protein IJL09_08190, partial [Lachnospiraceae bacterium]|nr:hypothetical protein [Lachnospiraceae bacterium]